MSQPDMPSRAVTPLDAALEYALRGWAVFPVNAIIDGTCTCKRDCGSPGKHPLVPRGLHEATTAHEVIREWWQRWPDANVAIATGAVSNLVVVDIDPPDGNATLTHLQTVGYELPATLAARTGSGGTHLLYQHPGVQIRNTARTLPGYDGKLAGVDLRGDGGYIVAPPSNHLSGATYRWIDGPTEPVPLPAWLREPERAPRHLTPVPPLPRDHDTTAYAMKALEEEIREIVQAVEGTRNVTLNAAAYSLGQLIAGGELDEAFVRSQLLIAAQAVELGEIEARRTIQSGIAAGIQHPRTAPPRPEYVPYEHSPHPADTEETPPDIPSTNGQRPTATTATSVPNTRRIRVLNDSQLADLPEPEWLVTDYLPAGGFAVLFGKPGSSKSFIALDIAYRITSGQKWFGGRAVDQGNVLYVVAEGVAGFKLRREAWRNKHPDADTSRAWFAAGAVNLLERREVDELVTVATELEPKMLVIDTLSRCMAGGDENSARDTGLVVAALERVQAATGAAILLLHHTGWDTTRERGSSNLRAVADASLELDAAGNLMTLKVVKAKDSEPPAPLHLQRTIVEIPGRVKRDGDPVTSCIIERASNVESAISGAARAALDALLDSDLGDGLTHSEWRTACEQTVPKSSFNRAINELIGLTAVEKVGEKRGARYRPVSPTVEVLNMPPEQGELL